MLVLSRELSAKRQSDVVASVAEVLFLQCDLTELYSDGLHLN